VHAAGVSPSRAGPPDRRTGKICEQLKAIAKIEPDIKEMPYKLIPNLSNLPQIKNLASVKFTLPTGVYVFNLKGRLRGGQK
jgi:hypothetical protein